MLTYFMRYLQVSGSFPNKGAYFKLQFRVILLASSLSKSHYKYLPLVFLLTSFSVAGLTLNLTKKQSTYFIEKS